MTPLVLSIGYEGSSINEFVDSLLSEGVEALIDVREIPISRKKGFSKLALRDHIEKAGIQYHHYKSLGSPKDLRHAVRQDGDYDTFFAGVRQHITSDQGQLSLSSIIELSQRSTICVMCFCRCWERCHRRVVLESLGIKRKVRTRHLVVGANEHPLFGAA